MTLTEKFNQHFPNEEAFMKAMGRLDDRYDDDISPRGSIPAACFQMAMQMRTGGAVREAQAPYGARVSRDTRAKR